MSVGLRVENIRKVYDKNIALNGVSLSAGAVRVREVLSSAHHRRTRPAYRRTRIYQ